MPPKRSGRADRNKQKQEEAERLAREEEERRLREEEERLQREEQEKKEREERERFEAEERKHLDAERKDYDEVRNNIIGRVEEQLTKKIEEHEWLHYTSCSTLPLVSDERALNTYISIFQEQTRPSKLDAALNRLKDLYTLIHEVSKEGNGSSCSAKYKQLNNVVSEGIDQITLSLMDCPSNNIDPETFNLIAEGEIQGQLQFCLWGNVVKNPRLKNFTFQMRNFDFELPKPMILADVAVRVLYPSYDLYSPLSRTYTCPTSPSTTAGSTVSISSRENNKDEGDLRESAVGVGESDEKNVTTPATPNKPLSRASTATKSKQETPNLPNEDKNEEKDKNEENDKPMEEQENDKDNGDDVEALDSTVELEDDEVDLRCFRPAGGLILLDLFTLPPQSKIQQEWTIKQVIVEGLKPVPHPVDTSSGAKIPISISLSLPQRYYFLNTDSMQLAMWDEDKLMWRSHGLQDISFNLDERSVSFKTLKFAPLAIMSDMYVNFPYQSWEVLPVGINHNHIHIDGGCVDVTISVKGDVCTVISPFDDSILADIINKPMPIDDMIQALSHVGYNFFPQPDVDKYASRTKKSEHLESAVYEWMAMSCVEWGFQWNQFNGDCGSNKVVLKTAHCSSEDWKELEVDHPDTNKFQWQLIICTSVKSYLLELQDSGVAEFTDTMKTGEESHSDLYTLLSKQPVSQINQLMTGIDPIHLHTVEKLLKATKPLSCT